MKIGIIGGGWYGCHIALELSRAGHDVTIFDKNDDIFKGVSGNYGIRLHKGPHYPRSEATRENCRKSFNQFCDTYPELVVQHKYAIYALGRKDSLGHTSKVNVEQFRQVCFESAECQEIDPLMSGYRELDFIATLDEPSIVIDKRLRDAFRKKLNDAEIQVNCNCSVQGLIKHGAQTSILTEDGVYHLYDKIINTTGFQAFIPPGLKQNFPINIEAVYQPCLALCYQDTKPATKPISFIVMDGWFPCLMPYIDQKPFQNKYILTHGNYTIMGSYGTPLEANTILDALTDDFVQSIIKSNAEREMCRFWPGFSERFHYLGWKGSVLVKLKTQREFRSAVTFEYENIIYAIPGKVSNIFNAAMETIALLANQQCITENGVRFVSGGVLDKARIEIDEKPSHGEPNTCTLDTYAELQKAHFVNCPIFTPAEKKSTILTRTPEELAS